ncbi:MAG TPA: uridylate kinase [Synergistaceae bacterium]|nr:uridylate kinase [Synergistaceae bacterium]
MRGVVKIGGSPGNRIAPLMEEIAERVSLGEEWVVVHGASGRMNLLCEEAGISPRHVTSPGGYRSRFVGLRERALFEAASARNSVEVLQLLAEQGGRGCPVFPSANRSAQAARKDSLRVLEEGRLRVLRGNYSGRISRVHTDEMEDILGCGGIPLLPPLGYDEESRLCLNVDGDRLAAAAAGALGASVLIIASNVPGLLEDPSREESLLSRGSLEDWELLENCARGNMKRKLLACREALEAGVPRVILCDSRRENPLRSAFEGGGTHLWSRRSMALAG